MTTRSTAVLATALLLLAACGADDPTVPGARDDAEGDAVSEASPDATRRAPRAREDKEKRTRRAGAHDDEGRRARRGAGGAGTGEGAAEDDGSSRWYPQRGLYTYAQSGWEEFCDASGCQREDLPPAQEVRTTHEGVSDNQATVATGAEASDNRFVRTTTRHTPEGASVTHVRVEFDYQGANFTNEYAPDPPVEVARLPLRRGMAWRGQWDARTSGTYSIKVGAKESVNVGGRTVQAWPLRVETRFRGDFEGTSDVTVWMDPATAVVVKSAGVIEVSSFFGDYRTRFEATLRDGPGYN